MPANSNSSAHPTGAAGASDSVGPSAEQAFIPEQRGRRASLTAPCQHPAVAARLCPYCRGLNGADESHCHHCGKPLAGSFMTGVLAALRRVVGTEYPGTRTILALVLVVFALCVVVDRKLPLGLPIADFLPPSFRASTLIRFGALGDVVADAAGRGLGELEPYRLLSAVFVHMGLLHVGMNMLVFVGMGRQLEAHFGAARLVILFLGSGVLGFVAS